MFLFTQGRSWALFTRICDLGKFIQQCRSSNCIFVQVEHLWYVYTVYVTISCDYGEVCIYHLVTQTFILVADTQESYSYLQSSNLHRMPCQHYCKAEGQKQTLVFKDATLAFEVRVVPLENVFQQYHPNQQLQILSQSFSEISNILILSLIHI